MKYLTTFDIGFFLPLALYLTYYILGTIGYGVARLAGKPVAYLLWLMLKFPHMVVLFIGIWLIAARQSFDGAMTYSVIMGGFAVIYSAIYSGVILKGEAKPNTYKAHVQAAQAQYNAILVNKVLVFIQSQKFIAFMQFLMRCKQRLAK